MGSQASESEVLRRRLSPERMGPYLNAAQGDLEKALELYAWNAVLASSIGATIGHVEVLLRNALHANLTEWSAAKFGEPRWYLDPGGYLRTRALDDVRSARQRLARGGQAETPGRVVTELNLGFWRYLLANFYDMTLWREALYRAFPGEARRRVVHDAAAVVHLCRNRIAHHEPIFNRPVEDIRFTALVLADWICPTSRVWIQRHCEIEAVLAYERP